MDGDALVDGLMRFSDLVQRRAKARELIGEFCLIGTRCGDCNKWMKSRECPKERNVDGMSRGPSANADVCDEYVEAWSVPALRAHKQNGLAAYREEVAAFGFAYLLEPLS